jgi:hypothetical protein
MRVDAFRKESLCLRRGAGSVVRLSRVLALILGVHLRVSGASLLFRTCGYRCDIPYTVAHDLGKEELFHPDGYRPRCIRASP